MGKSISVIVLSNCFGLFAFLLDLSLSADITNPEFLVIEADRHVYSSDKAELLSSWLDRQPVQDTDKAHQRSVKVMTQRESGWTLALYHQLNLEPVSFLTVGGMTHDCVAKGLWTPVVVTLTLLLNLFM